MLEESALVQTVRSLRDGDAFLTLVTRLGYKVFPAEFKPADLHPPPRLAKLVSRWWVVSNYAGNPLFQIHLVELQHLHWQNICSLMDSFRWHHPVGFFFFAFTTDYTWLALSLVESVLERRFQRHYGTWLLLPQPYYRLFLFSPANVTHSEVQIFSRLRNLPPSDNSLELYLRVRDALKSLEQLGYFPVWFFPLQEVKHRLSLVRGSIEECLRWQPDRRLLTFARSQLSFLLEREEYCEVLSEGSQAKLWEVSALILEALSNLSKPWGDPEIARIALAEAAVELGIDPSIRR